EVRSRWTGTLDRRRMIRETEALVDELDVRIPSPRATLRELSGGQRQGIAIARATHWASTLVLMDEPTAALGVAETQKVEETIMRLRARGAGILIVSHNMDQVFRLADRIAVLRRGVHVGTKVAAETSHNEIVSMITGLASGDARPATVHPVRRGPCRGPEAGPPAHDRSPSRAASDRTGPGPPDLGSLAPGTLNGFAEGPGGRRRRACYGALTRVAERRGEHVSWGGRDFTRGATLRQLATFSGPIVLANLLQTLFQLVDSLWVGNLLGAQALGAVAISGTVIFVALAFVIGMNNA